MLKSLLEVNANVQMISNEIKMEAVLQNVTISNIEIDMETVNVYKDIGETHMENAN